MAIMMGHRVEVRRVEARAGTTTEAEQQRDSISR
jgi:hypothetical protein